MKKTKLIRNIILAMACLLVAFISLITPTYAYDKLLTPLTNDVFTLNSQKLNEKGNLDLNVWANVMLTEPEAGAAKAVEIGTDYVII